MKVPRDEKFAKVQELLDKIKERGATHWTLSVSKKEEGASAEVVSQPQTPSKRVAAVVGELLDGGVRKISVEVKK